MLGVTSVAVSPLARRRGVASALMQHVLEQAHTDGYVATALWASEPRIYGRFGYGCAARMLSLEIPRDRRWLRPVPGTGDVALRLIEPSAAADLVQTVQNADAARRPGLFAWAGTWIDRILADAPDLRNGASPLRVVEARVGEVVTGYAIWRNKADWAPTRPGGTVQVSDVRANDPASYAAIWGLLADYDLMGSAGTRRPTDDPLMWLLDDWRAAQVQVSDALHVRLIDVPAALQARRYAVGVDTVLEVTDELAGWNAGRWRLQGGPDSASCARTDATAEIALDVRDLSALYLGAGSLPEMVRAGIVDECMPGAAIRVGAALASEVAPWSDTVF